MASGIPGLKWSRNGVDVEKFSPNREAGAAIRAELGIPAGDPVIGMVGSFKFQKGHEFFLRMGSRGRKEIPKRLVFGFGRSAPNSASTTYHQEMLKLAESLNFRGPLPVSRNAGRTWRLCIILLT